MDAAERLGDALFATLRLTGGIDLRRCGALRRGRLGKIPR
jgi:hypothetical protein